MEKDLSTKRFRRLLEVLRYPEEYEKLKQIGQLTEFPGKMEKMI